MGSRRFFWGLRGSKQDLSRSKLIKTIHFLFRKLFNVQNHGNGIYTNGIIKLLRWHAGRFDCEVTWLGTRWPGVDSRQAQGFFSTPPRPDTHILNHNLRLQHNIMSLRVTDALWEQHTTELHKATCLSISWINPTSWNVRLHQITHVFSVLLCVCNISSETSLFVFYLFHKYIADTETVLRSKFQFYLFFESIVWS